MPGVIKGRIGSYVYVNNFDTDQPVMKTVYGKRQESVNSGGSGFKSNKTRPGGASVSNIPSTSEAEAEANTEAAEKAAAAANITNAMSSREAKAERERLVAEYEAIRDKYEKESEDFVLRAREKATEIYEKTKELAQQTVLDAQKEAEQIKKQAEEDIRRQAEEGRKQGFEEGEKKGYDEGYVKALRKCKETLLELKSLSEQVTADKSELMMQYERQLFDTIFDICQRITLGVLGQKEKGLITRMIREAGKKYRASKNIKITLSKLDVSEEAEIDEQLLKDVFKNCDNVEIELLEDAPAGTLMIDDGTEITDAGIQTQLKMVEQLGKGKYRDRDITDMIKDQAASKSKRGGAHKKKADDGYDEDETEQSAAEASEDPIPDVVYKKEKPPPPIDDDDDDEFEKEIENA